MTRRARHLRESQQRNRPTSARDQALSQVQKMREDTQTEQQTANEQKSGVNVEEEKRPMFLMNPGPKLADIVKAVNAIGASPADLVAILEALKQAGAMKAELVVL